MKPIGLVTCYFHHNYGSMLQAYATEMIMKKLKLPYQTIACKRPKDYMTANKYAYIIKKLLIADWKMWVGKRKIAKAMATNPNFKANVSKRNEAFDKFARDYFITSRFCKTRQELKVLANEFSAFLVGSDQLWRTDSVEHGYYTLEWVPDEIKKIAYSTSIGVTEVPWFQIEKNKRFMNRFDFIALREQSACDLVKRLTGRNDVELVLDPTLLFTGEEWLHIQQESPLTQEKYIFCYLLGNNPEQRSLIKEVARLSGYKIVALQHLDEYIPSDEGFADESPYVGPCEFLNYIRHAEMVFTDSFHCSVFSILYHKNFFTFNRFSENAKQSTNTRIDNLLNVVGLSGRRMNKQRNANYVLNFSRTYDGVDERLEEMRKNSWAYLNRALL